MNCKLQRYGDTMKRLCIYLIYDKQNIVDKYIAYMLKICVDKLVVVCNMTGILQGMEYITAYVNMKLNALLNLENSYIYYSGLLYWLKKKTFFFKSSNYHIIR